MNKNLIICIIIFFIIYLILFSINYFIKNNIIKIEYFNNKIYFLNKNELYEYLIKNEDHYYEYFYNNDFKTRKINKINDYYNYIKISVKDFNKDEKKKLMKCINSANNLLKSINMKWFDGNKAFNIEWIIGCIKGKLYENGLPHTRGNIIIISEKDINNYSEDKLIKTLIHEKVHIYQKIYYNDCIIYLKENNFIKYKKREEIDNIRANPDLDEWIYKDKNGNIYNAQYHDNPLTIEDITYKPYNNQSYEHPFEKMAIEIENLV
jgi:hypothetical protein